MSLRISRPWVARSIANILVRTKSYRPESLNSLKMPASSSVFDLPEKTSSASGMSSRTARRASAGVSATSTVRLRRRSASATPWRVCSDACAVKRSAVWLIGKTSVDPRISAKLVRRLPLGSYEYLRLAVPAPARKDVEDAHRVCTVTSSGSAHSARADSARHRSAISDPRARCRVLALSARQHTVVDDGRRQYPPVPGMPVNRGGLAPARHQSSRRETPHVHRQL